MRCSATGIALVHDVWHEIVDGNCLGAVCNLVRNAGQSRGIASFGRSCAFVDTIPSGLTVHLGRCDGRRPQSSHRRRVWRCPDLPLVLPLTMTCACITAACSNPTGVCSAATCRRCR
jgi:hypothetical protein